LTVMKKFGIFGGTFNPIHNGHLIIAELAREFLQLERVIFIPSAHPPHKIQETLISFEHRAAMVRLAIAGNDDFDFSGIEKKYSLAYTADTLLKLKKLFPNTEFHLIIGSDSLLALNTWKTPELLIRRATLAVFPRANFDAQKAEKRFLDRAVILPMPVVEVSSSWVRTRIEKKETIRYVVPRDVEKYIIKNKLYV
jgi:nicotinate-nucleotide adenylyltransferase